MLTDTHRRNGKSKKKSYRLNEQRGSYLEVKLNGANPTEFAVCGDTALQ